MLLKETHRGKWYTIYTYRETIISTYVNLAWAGRLRHALRTSHTKRQEAPVNFQPRLSIWRFIYRKCPHFPHFPHFQAAWWELKWWISLCTWLDSMLFAPFLIQTHILTYGWKCAKCVKITSEAYASYHVVFYLSMYWNR